MSRTPTETLVQKPGKALRHTHHTVAAAALLALNWGAQAQTSTAGQLQTINVTAERRLENIRDVPSSVSTLQGEVLDVLNTSGQDVRLLSGRVPSLSVESSFGRAFPRFYIRGYGNVDFRLNASQPVSLVYDDVVQENPILKGFPVFDVESVEVLRGPQGTLFGRNTPAGVVKFNSVKPTNKMEGYGSLSAGTYSTVNAEGAVNVPLGAGMALRVSLLNQTRNDWVHNTVATGPTQNLEGYRDSALRAQFLFDPSKELSVLANVHARDFKGSARLFRANIIEPGTNSLVPGFDPGSVTYDGKNESKLQNLGGNLRIRYDLGGMALYSITGFEQVHTFSRGDIDGGTPAGPGFILFPVETADGLPKHSQFTQEFRLESTAPGPFSWQAGAFLFSETYDVESYAYDSTTPGNPQTSYERVRQTNDAAAVFGAVKYALTPALSLRFGLRYSQDKKKLNVLDYTNGADTIDTLAAAGPIEASPKDNKLSWDLSALYAIDAATNVYARAATGFRASSIHAAGAFNGQSVATPENNTSFEAGIKADLFNKRARLNFGVFSYEVKDLQLTAVGGGSNATNLLNAKKATGQGFELDLQALITEQLLTTFSLGYNKTQIKDPGLAVPVCGLCSVTLLNPTNSAGQALIDGNALPKVPKVTAGFTLKYSQPVSGGGEVYAFTDWVYRDKVNFFLYQSIEYTGKALTEGGLRLGYTWANGKYDVAGFVRNITNQIRVVDGLDINNKTGLINDPRTLGVQFKAFF